MSGFLVGVALVLSTPLWCHSSRKCMRSLQDPGRHLSLPKSNLVAPPPSPPSMVEPFWGTWARQFTLPSHTATHLPPPPLESEASTVPSCHPHPRSVQSGGRRAVSSSTTWGVVISSPGGPVDLESVWSCSGRPVCISKNMCFPQ